jgi:hypothetical protein
MASLSLLRLYESALARCGLTASRRISKVL